MRTTSRACIRAATAEISGRSQVEEQLARLDPKEAMMTEDRVPQSVSKITDAGKRPYKKPEFRFERVFETMALACGKVGPNEIQCHFNGKNS